jgi:hypothetical protein
LPAKRLQALNIVSKPIVTIDAFDSKQRFENVMAGDLFAAIAVVALGASNVCIECETRHPSSRGDLLRPALVFTQPK